MPPALAKRPYTVLPLPRGKGEFGSNSKSVNDRRNMLTTWAKLIGESLGKATMRRLCEPYQDGRSFDQSLEAGTYLFHAFPGSKATLDGGLKPMSFSSGALKVKLDCQCWFDACLMGSLEHVYDKHFSAIVLKGGISVAAIGPGAADDYYAHVASK